jgi:hypothetical protein
MVSCYVTIGVYDKVNWTGVAGGSLGKNGLIMSMPGMLRTINNVLVR